MKGMNEKGRGREKDKKEKEKRRGGEGEEERWGRIRGIKIKGWVEGSLERKVIKVPAIWDDIGF